MVRCECSSPLSLPTPLREAFCPFRYGTVTAATWMSRTLLLEKEGAARARARHDRLWLVNGVCDKSQTARANGRFMLSSS